VAIVIIIATLVFDYATLAVIVVIIATLAFPFLLPDLPPPSWSLLTLLQQLHLLMPYASHTCCRHCHHCHTCLSID
jgi:hypothetical protein